MENNLISKPELIELIYKLNGINWVKVNEIYSCEDDKYKLKLTNTQGRWQIAIYLKANRAIVIEIVFNPAWENAKDKLKITKKEAKKIADFVFLAWNNRSN